MVWGGIIVDEKIEKKIVKKLDKSISRKFYIFWEIDLFDDTYFFPGLFEIFLALQSLHIGNIEQL